MSENDIDNNKDDDDDDVVTNALRKARYNEIVHVSIDSTTNVEEGVGTNVTNDQSNQPITVSDTTKIVRIMKQQQPNSSTSKTISLIPRLNEQQGGVQFMNILDLAREQQLANSCGINNATKRIDNDDKHNDAIDDNDDDVILLQKELQTKQWFFPMLNDKYRNECYYNAITNVLHQCIRKKLRQHQQQLLQKSNINRSTNDMEPPTTTTDNSITIHVLDIGSGTGLLSFMITQIFYKYYCNQNNNTNQQPIKVKQQQQQQQQQKDKDSTTKNKTKNSNEPILKLHITSIEMSLAFGLLAQRTIEENCIYLDDTNQIQITLYPGQHSTSSMFNSCCSKGNNNNNNNDDNKHIEYDICLSELFDHTLLGEGWIPTIRDAWDRHLYDNNNNSNNNQCIQSKSFIIPCAAKVHATIVTAPFLYKYCRPSFDLSNDNEYKKHTEYLIDTCHVALPIHVNKLLRDGSVSIVSNKQLIFDFNVSSKYTLPTSEGRTNTVSFTMDHNRHNCKVPTDTNNTEYGVLIWWDMILWDQHNKHNSNIDDSDSKNSTGSDIVYSLHPNGQQPFQDHWCPCLYLFPNDKDNNMIDIFNTINRTTIDKSTTSTIDVTFRHDDYRMFIDHVQLHSSQPPKFLSSDKDNNCGSSINNSESYNRKRNNQSISDDDTSSQICTLPQQIQYISQERAFQLNDLYRRQIFQSSMEKAIRHKQEQVLSLNTNDANTNPMPITILDISDFAFGACIAATICRNMINTNTIGHNLYQFKIISIENSSGQLPTLSSRVLANFLTDSNINNNDTEISKNVDVQVLQSYNEDITINKIGNTVDILFSEPYYEVLEGWHVQEALNYYYTIQILRRNSIIGHETIIVPGECLVLGCIIESSDLRNAYGRISEPIHGIQHTYINHVGRDGRGYEMTLPMWQYDYTVLSNTLELGSFKYNDPNAPQVPESTTVIGSFHKRGQCDALLVWLQYSFPIPSFDGDLNKQKDCDTSLSTNSQSYNQQVQMLGIGTTNYSDMTIEQSEVDHAQVICNTSFGGSRLESHEFNIHIIKG